jgi:iron-sulfur cluster assembly protein
MSRATSSNAVKAWVCAWALKPQVAAEDVVFEGHGVKVLIDPKSLPYLDGTELDFVREGLNEGFKFHNPREKDKCGCGESFRV